MKITILLCAVTMLAQPVTAAPRQDQDSVQNIIVNFADLDLRSTAAQRRLRDRIAFAAYRLCLSDMSASPSPAVADTACMRATIARASQQMSQAISRAIHRRVLATAAPLPAR